MCILHLISANQSKNIHVTTCLHRLNLNYFYRSEGGQSYYHYFAPPFPNNIVMFAINKSSIQERFEVKVGIDPGVEDKKIGELSRDKDCFVWKVDLTEEEMDATNKVLKMV